MFSNNSLFEIPYHLQNNGRDCPDFPTILKHGLEHVVLDETNRLTVRLFEMEHGVGLDNA